MSSEPSQTASHSRSSLPENVKVLGWASFLNDVASEMIYPLMPQFLITVLGGNRFHLGIIEGFADSASSLLKLASGAWSDRAGSRKLLVFVGYALAALSRPMIGFVITPWQMFAARISDRVGKGIRTSPRDALIADSTDPSNRGQAFGFHRAMDHLGAAVGPLIALAFLWLRPGDYRTLFMLTIIPGLLVLWLLRFRLTEPASHTARSVPLTLTLQPFGRPFRLYLLSLVVFTLGNSSDAFLLVRAGELGIPTGMLPLVWFAFHVVKSGSNLLAGRLVDRIGPWIPIFVGWLGYAAVYLGFGMSTAAWQAWCFFLAYAVFYALTEPAEKTLVANLVGLERKGLAFGWYNFAIGVAALPSSLIFGGLYERFGPLIAFGWGATTALVAAILLACVRIVR